jgi:arginyl-tRNA synthetase
MDFDMNLAREQSKKNPVYYIQYAGARASSVLERAKVKNKKSETNLNFQILNSKTEGALILKLMQFPEIIEDISNDHSVHHLPTYTYELAKVFTDFYENTPVLDAGTDELKQARLDLVYLSRQVFESALGLMGISVPEKM